ncbi:cytochrome c oxidase subunit II [Pseudanabaena sp. PCC 6802]|uniref:cytochrome c oxidase subunit II n=1 Tax=Pseudanabaena sp. PCC 6802 TaxID=118173 RepID=UPI000348F919|nr:cytochrome c oxidase subunit II [Pseudanabaena sp. PCC 6802]
MNARKTISVVTVLCLIVISGIWYGNNHGLLPLAASDEASLYDGLFNTLTALATALFLLVEGTLLFCIFRFRRRPDDNTDGPPIRDNFTLELIWTAVPTVIVMFVGIYSFDVYSAMRGNSPALMMAMSHDLSGHHQPAHHQPAAIAPDKLANKLGIDKLGIEPVQASILTSNTDRQSTHVNSEISNLAEAMPSTKPPDSSNLPGAGNVEQPDLSTTNINVTAMQFAWIFSYPDYNNIETAELHVPVGSKVNLNLKATDVIHAFWVPQIRLKQDVIPGLPTQLQFTANKIGDYPVVCAELCGAYHGGMRAQLFVDTPDGFQAWVKTTQEELASNPSKRVIAANSLNQPTTAMTDREYLAGRMKNMEAIEDIDITVLHSVPQPVRHSPDLSHLHMSRT